MNAIQVIKPVYYFTIENSITRTQTELEISYDRITQSFRLFVESLKKCTDKQINFENKNLTVLTHLPKHVLVPRIGIKFINSLDVILLKRLVEIQELDSVIFEHKFLITGYCRSIVSNRSRKDINISQIPEFINQIKTVKKIKLELDWQTFPETQQICKNLAEKCLNLEEIELHQFKCTGNDLKELLKIKTLRVLTIYNAIGDGIELDPPSKYNLTTFNLSYNPLHIPHFLKMIAQFPFLETLRLNKSFKANNEANRTDENYNNLTSLSFPKLPFLKNLSISATLTEVLGSKFYQLEQLEFEIGEEILDKDTLEYLTQEAIHFTKLHTLKCHTFFYKPMNGELDFIKHLPSLKHLSIENGVNFSLEIIFFRKQSLYKFFKNVFSIENLETLTLSLQTPFMNIDDDFLFRPKKRHTSLRELCLNYKVTKDYHDPHGDASKRFTFDFNSCYPCIEKLSFSMEPNYLTQQDINHIFRLHYLKMLVFNSDSESEKFTFIGSEIKDFLKRLNPIR